MISTGWKVLRRLPRWLPCPRWWCLPAVGFAGDGSCGAERACGDRYREAGFIQRPCAFAFGAGRGGQRADALAQIRADIGDCTRCPLAYGGRRTIVFGDGDANARLMFVGEGPGADEDAQGLPFVGKSGQLLNNMIAAMGLQRENVYIANIVKCRPPANRAPEPLEANTCTQFLVQQMDVVQPEYVVALGATAAMYLLGVKQSLASLRGRFHEVRGAKLAVTLSSCVPASRSAAEG